MANPHPTLIAWASWGKQSALWLTVSLFLLMGCGRAIPGAGHALLPEQPTLIADHLIAFLRQQTGK